jgi:hypothetical protein
MNTEIYYKKMAFRLKKNTCFEIRPLRGRTDTRISQTMSYTHGYSYMPLSGTKLRTEKKIPYPR